MKSWKATDKCSLCIFHRGFSPFLPFSLLALHPRQLSLLLSFSLQILSLHIIGKASLRDCAPFLVL